MTEPLALVVYEKLLPGTQLANKLKDLHYRVLSVTDGETLVACAQQEKPMVIIADLTSTRTDMRAIIQKLRDGPDTRHIPVIAFGTGLAEGQSSDAQGSGPTLVVDETGVLNHLPQLLDQALQLE